MDAANFRRYCTNLFSNPGRLATRPNISLEGDNYLVDDRALVETMLHYLYDYGAKNLSSRGETRTTLPILVFADGSAKNNGRAGCKARWSYVILDYISESVLANIGEVLCENTNNRAELQAIATALRRINSGDARGQVIVYSDSEYAIKSYGYYKSWLSTPKVLKKKKNLDLISLLSAEIDALEKKNGVVMVHVNGHKALSRAWQSPSEDSFEAFGNALVDYLASASLLLQSGSSA